MSSHLFTFFTTITMFFVRHNELYNNKTLCFYYCIPEGEESYIESGHNVDFSH